MGLSSNYRWMRGHVKPVLLQYSHQVEFLVICLLSTADRFLDGIFRLSWIRLNVTLRRYYSIYFQNGALLSCQCVNAVLAVLLIVCRVKGVLTSHGFRIVAATIAATAGVPVLLVPILGHWSSDACKLYILGFLNPILLPFRRDSLSCQANYYRKDFCSSSFAVLSFSHFDNFNFFFQLTTPEYFDFILFGTW